MHTKYTCIRIHTARNRRTHALQRHIQNIYNNIDALFPNKNAVSLDVRARNSFYVKFDL